MKNTHLYYNILLIPFIACLIGINQEKDSSLQGNWRSMNYPEKNKVYQELFIDSITVTSFNADIKGVSYSLYYNVSNNIMYLISENKKDTLNTIKFTINENKLTFKIDSMTTEYVRVKRGILLEDYLKNDTITYNEFLKDFNDRYLRHLKH